MNDVSNHDKVNYHAPTPEGAQRHKDLSVEFGDLLDVIDAIVPEGREKALAKTKIEEAKMWASAGVARNPATR